MSTSEETVLVTGGSGYVAGWVIVALLRRGYRVRATLRSLTREAEVRAAVARHITADDRLAFAVADLTDDAGWAQACAGCACVMHVASPVGAGQGRAGNDLIRPAREGTRRVLQAAERAGVRHVVLTSSAMAAMPAQQGGDLQIDEDTWTDPEAPGLFPYARAKTLAERDAWEWVGQSPGGMTLTTVLPGFVQGPLLGSHLSPSLELLQRLLNGKMPRLPRIGFSVVDVRDLAELHVLAMTEPQAAGQRFLGAGGFMWLTEMSEVLRTQLGAPFADRVPTKLAPDWLIRVAGLFNAEARQVSQMLGRRRLAGSAKAERLLGWRPRPSADAILDTARSLIAEGTV